MLKKPFIPMYTMGLHYPLCDIEEREANITTGRQIPNKFAIGMLLHTNKKHQDFILQDVTKKIKEYYNA